MNDHQNATAYVTTDGTYGDGDILLFHSESLTAQQWENLHYMDEDDRYLYVKAILEGDLEEVVGIESKYEPDYIPELDGVYTGDPSDIERPTIN